MEWRFSTFILLMLSLLAWFSWATSETGLCHDQFVRDVLAQKNKDGALNCFEFWFNRYQTMLGVLVAVGAAWFTWSGARKQVQAANQQRAVSLIPIIHERLEAAKKIERAIVSLSSLDNQMGESMYAIFLASINIIDSENSKERDIIYEIEFYDEAILFLESANIFNKRVTLIREQLQSALLPRKVRLDIEKYLEIAQSIDKFSQTASEHIKRAMDSKGWNITIMHLKRITISNRRFCSIDLRNHAAISAINRATYELSILLDIILEEAHKL